MTSRELDAYTSGKNAEGFAMRGEMAIVGENKAAAAILSSQFKLLPPEIQSLHKHAEKVQHTVEKLEAMKIPEEVHVSSQVRHTVEPVTLKYLWIFFKVSLLLLAGAGFWGCQAVGAKEEAVKGLQDYQSAYKPERVKWLQEYFIHMAEKRPGDTKAYIKANGAMPDN